jgi:HEAT repeat protein
MIYALMGLGPEAAPAMAPLLNLTRHEDFHTRYWACRGIGRMGMPAARPAVGALVEALKDPIASVRGNAAAALGKLGPEVANEALEPLMTAVADQSYNVRDAAAIALGQFGPAAKDSVAALEESLARPGAGARVHAAVSIWQITGRDQPAVKVLLEEINSRDEPWEAAQGFRTLGAAAAGAVDRLVEIARSENPETRLFAAEALGALGPSAKAALPRLKELQNDPDESVRETAAKAIEAIEAKEQPD